jgi:NAD(P)H-dependent FMN reductase
MGRYTGPDFLDVDAGRIYLRRVPLNSGGYDAGDYLHEVAEELAEQVAAAKVTA